MIRGISATIPNRHDTFLKSIFSDVPIANYVWQIGPGEWYRSDNGSLTSSLLPDHTYISGAELEKLIEQLSYVIFADLKAFPRDRTDSVTDYDEYKKSSCEMVLLISDAVNLELYCENPDMLNQFLHNISLAGFENIDYITDENDGRTSFSVL